MEKFIQAKEKLKFTEEIGFKTDKRNAHFST